MLKTRFVRFRHLSWVTLKKTLASANDGFSSSEIATTRCYPFSRHFAVPAIGLFEESLQSTFKELVVQLSQVAPDEALIRDF